MAKRLSSSAGLQLSKFSTTPKSAEPKSKRKRIEKIAVAEIEPIVPPTQKVAALDKDEPPARRTRKKKAEVKEAEAKEASPEEKKPSKKQKQDKKPLFVPTDGTENEFRMHNTLQVELAAAGVRAVRST